MPALQWAAWSLGLLSLGSAFAPLGPSFLRTSHWLLCVFSVLEAGIAIGRGRRWAFLTYAALAVLVNPIRPFRFSIQVWRMIHAGAGLWLLADHLPGRD